MKEQNIKIEVTATADVKVNGVAIPESSVIIKKTTVIVEQLEITVPNVNVS